MQGQEKHIKSASINDSAYKKKSGSQVCILRSIDSFSTAHTVLETISPQTGNIIVNNFHLLTLKACVCIQVELMVGTILQRQNQASAIY